MSQSLCLRCLQRSFLEFEFAAPTAARTFSTSSSLAANPPKKKGVVGKPTTRQGRTLKLAKNRPASTSRPPAVGERKALRKKVVLSNTNALEVGGLQNLTKENCSSEQLQAAQGTVLGLSNETVDTLRALDGFKPTQGWSMFRRPACLIRAETVELAGDLEWAAQGGAPGRVVRKVLCGARGSGKSVLQLQALAMASLKSWVVMHVPEGKDLTIAHTSYRPLSTPSGTMYIQPHYTSNLLGALVKANQAVLRELRVGQEHKLPIPVSSDTSLARLAELGSRDPELAWPVWEALWKELLAPSQHTVKGLARPPVLFTLDSLDHIMRDSAYLDKRSDPIHAHKLTLVKQFVDLLSGKTALPNGGVILGAVSESNRAAAHTLDHCLERNLAVQKAQEPPRWDPYLAHDKRVQDAMNSVGVSKTHGLSRAEARGIMEYYAHSGILRNTVTEGLVGERWTLAGNGIIGQIEKGSLLATV